MIGSHLASVLAPLAVLVPMLAAAMTLFAGCQAPVDNEPAATRAVLHGEVWYRQRSALPPDAVLDVSLLDVSRMETEDADLIPEALRQNLSRLIVGEVRGGEAGAMFEAATSGAGLISTTHSHSATSAIDRLASRVAQGGVLTVEEAKAKGMNPKMLCSFVDGSKAMIEMAALANAAASHVAEQDDVHNGSVFHPAAVVFAPALAVARSCSSVMLCMVRSFINQGYLQASIVHD